MNNLANYLYEIGQLKRVKRSGWWIVGIKDPESVAEHSFRTSVLGYILASLEGADPQKTAIMCLFHDMGEARITDLHQTAKRYIDVGLSEEAAFKAQIERLPYNIAEKALAFFQEYEERASLESWLAHEADLLECLIQAREYEAQGYVAARDWITNCYSRLKTDSAKNIADACLRVEPTEWWKRE
jgi:putative hydrolase of HD superfamily